MENGQRLQAILAASGTGFDNVVMMNSFHVWDSPHFAGGRFEQFGAFNEAAQEYIRPPYPAWTAVGTIGLLDERGLVEVQLIARILPRAETPQ